MKDLLVQSFEGQEFTIINYKGKPHFVAKEVCEILEINHVSKFTNSLSDTQKKVLEGRELNDFRVLQSTYVQNGHKSKTRKRVPCLTLLTEPGL